MRPSGQTLPDTEEGVVPDALPADELGITQKFIRPTAPGKDGKVERLNRTLATEWAHRRPFTTNQQRTDALALWLEHYNTECRHRALGGQPPISRLSPT